MARETWIWDADRQAVVPKAEYCPRGGLTIIGDIQPYQAVGADIATGAAPVIGGRRQHREFLRRNGYIEVGNEPPKPPKPLGDHLDSPRGAIIDAMRQHMR